MKIRTALILFLVVLSLPAGCSPPQLAPSPNLFLAGDEDTFDEVQPMFQSDKIAVMYLTDRIPEEGKDGMLGYGYGRSHSLAFGKAVIRIGSEGTTWDDVVAASRTRKRAKPMTLRLVEVDEIARGPNTHLPYIVEDGAWVLDPDLPARREAAAADVRVFLRRWIEEADGNDVYLYVHGYNNSFEAAIFRMAGIWHFLGRHGVPICYSWPAGRGGLSGYAYDRESGEFSVSHLKGVLKGLAGMPEIGEMNIIAHSRGKDVVLDALRELNIEFNAAGKNLREELRINNLILAAGDMDWQVFQQRVGGEQMADIAERLTVYVSKDDKALGMAQWLFHSISRLGDLASSVFSPEQQAKLQANDKIQIIEVKIKNDFLGHGYFASNPNVLSDLVRILRDDRDPGAENGRPLEREGGFWELREGYLMPVRSGD